MQFRHGIAAACLGSVVLLCSAAASADQDVGLNTSFAGAPPTSSNLPWVNLLFRDLGFLTGTQWEHTVELQISTDPFLHTGSCCDIDGKGHLAPTEYVDTLLLNFNPSLDITKLRVKWAGLDGFPVSGAAPTSSSVGVISIADPPPASGDYDIQVNWNGTKLGTPGTSFVKLLFIYNNGSTDINPEDFFFLSTQPAGSTVGPYYAAAHISGINGDQSGWIAAAAVPEPETYVLLAIGLGLLAAAGARRRKSTRG